MFHIDTAREIATWVRFGIALAALSVSYMWVLWQVHKYEGGLYPENLIPDTVSDDMRRARSFFLKLVLGVAGAACLATWGLSMVMDHSTWVATVWPALGGVLFGMLYGGTTRYHRIRPRDLI